MKYAFVQFLKYCLVGFLTSIIDIIVFYLLMKFGLETYTSLTIAFLVSLLFNLSGHNYFTFGCAISFKKVQNYLAVVLFNYFTTVFLVFSFQNLNISTFAGKIFSIPICTIFGYILCKRWIFSKWNQC